MEEIRAHLANHDFRSLFIERLGWDIAHGQVTATLSPGTVALTRIAHKRGVQAFVCEVDFATLVDRKRLRQIDSDLAYHAAEHVAIYHCRQPRQQCWQWAAAGPGGKRLRHREHPFTSRVPPEKVVARIHALSIAFEAEDNITVSDVSRLLRTAFDNNPEFATFFSGARWRARSESLHRKWRESRSVEDLNEFLKVHLPLLAWAVKKFAPRRFDPDDAAQVAFFALRRAAEGFDPDHGTQFSTYASRALMQLLMRAAPAHMDLIKCRSTYYRTFRRLEREAEHFGLTQGPWEGDAFLESAMLQRTGVSASAFRSIRTIDSLDDRSQPFARMLRSRPDPSPSPLETLIHREDIGRIPGALASLDDQRNANIIALRHGLDGSGNNSTLQDIADKYGLSRERIRQIEDRVTKDLRNRFDAPTEREQAARLAWRPQRRVADEPLPPHLAPAAAPAAEPSHGIRATRRQAQPSTFQLRAQESDLSARLFDDWPARPLPLHVTTPRVEHMSGVPACPPPPATDPLWAALEAAGAAGLLVTDLIVVLGRPGAEVRSALHALAHSGQIERTPELRWRLSRAARARLTRPPVPPRPSEPTQPAHFALSS